MRKKTIRRVNQVTNHLSNRGQSLRGSVLDPISDDSGNSSSDY